MKTMMTAISFAAISLATVFASTANSQVSSVAKSSLSESAQGSGMKAVKLNHKRRGVAADLQDQGDYYFRADGSKIRFLRKKNVYVVEAAKGKAKKVSNSLKTAHQGRIEQIRQHNLGGLNVIRVRNPDAAKSYVQSANKQKAQYEIVPSMIKSLDSSIVGLKPVFANERGQGDILLMPRLTVKLQSAVKPKQALRKLLNRYSLTLDRKLRLSGNVYSLKLANPNMSESQQFALVRSIMNEPLVKWAEPQFTSKPFKTSFEPSDSLFSSQWHLRNTGLGGSRCDSDCDANDAWDIGDVDGVGAVSGALTVIAIIDDGVQIDHEDLDDNIWINPGETATIGDASNDIDDDNNSYIDDVFGWDFVVDSATNPLLQSAALEGSGTCGADGVDTTPGQDNDPSPQATSDCAVFGGFGQAVENDDHGTAVAGIAAAESDGSVGVVGTAFNAKILPIRLISEFDTGVDFCNRASEAMAYAGRYADVISNSWGVDTPCMALENTIAEVVAGTLMAGSPLVNVSHRKSTDVGSGSPVLFASGNSASGWIKVTVPIPTAGEHAFEWRFLRNPFGFADGTSTSDENSVYLDDITWPGESSVSVDFEAGFSLAANDFVTNNVLNTCDAFCVADGFLSELTQDWTVQASPDPVLSGSMAIKVDASDTDCGNTYLTTLRETAAGNISFWVWVSSDTSEDKFEFLVDGKEVISFGDIIANVDNSVSYPANLASTIAVGASDAGDLSGTTTADLGAQRRVWYSQYGAALDILAPSSNQHLAITTTDREGSDGYGVGNYTSSFGGTSASTPMVAGIAAAIIAIDNDLDASEVRTILQDSADQIGNTAYIAGRNDFYGHGRVNMLKALQSASGIAQTDPIGVCLSPSFSYSPPANDLVLSSFSPTGAFCSAQGPLPQTDEICFPIKATNGNVAVICL